MLRPGCCTKLPLCVLSRCDRTPGVLSGVVLFRRPERGTFKFHLVEYDLSWFLLSGTEAVMSPQDIQLIMAVSPYYVRQFRLHLSPITKKIIWGNNDPLIFFFLPPPVLQSILPASKSVFKLHHLVCKFALKI